MNPNLKSNANKITKKEKKSLEIERDMSIENVSLSPQPESDNTRTYKISRLVNRLLKKTKRVLKTYKENRKVLKKKPGINKHFGNKISRAITDLDDVIEYMNKYNRHGHFREHSVMENMSINSRKVKSKKRKKIKH